MRRNNTSNNIRSIRLVQLMMLRIVSVNLAALTTRDPKRDGDQHGSLYAFLQHYISIRACDYSKHLAI